MGDAELEQLKLTVARNLETACDKLVPVVNDLPAEQVVCIAGATGVGKSSLADQLAQRIGGEVVSADSMQVYRHMDIGTAKVPPAQRGVAYHCIDLVDPGQPYSASLYQRDARAAIADIISRGKRPVMCGGTGLYIRAALDIMEFPAGDQVGNEVRDRYMQLAQEHGNEYVHAILQEQDPESAALIHPNNVRRTVRALEMLAQGESYARQAAGMKDFTPFMNALYIGLTMETNSLYRAIDARVDQMMQDGLLDEVRGLVDDGFRDAITSSQAIGYKEFLDVFDGSCTVEEAVESIKRSTRRYSKRQRTWFRRDPRIEWIQVDQQ